MLRGAEKGNLLVPMGWMPERTAVLLSLGPVISASETVRSVIGMWVSVFLPRGLWTAIKQRGKKMEVAGHGGTCL